MKCGNLVCLVLGELKLFLKMGENKSFDVSNIEGELVYFCFILFICLSFHTCGDGFFGVFSRKTDTF